jgi:DNA-binding NtrC family response regulator
VADLAVTHDRVLVTGERGVGKLRAALALVTVRGLEPVFFDTSDAGALGTEVWLENVAASLHELADDSVVVVARLERLDPEVLESLADLIDGRSVPSVATALAEANGNKDLAAHLIGIHRATLYRKLQNYGLDWTPDA